MTYTDRHAIVPLLRRIGQQSRSLQPLGVSNAAWAIVSMEWHVRGGTHKPARSVLRRLSLAAYSSAGEMSAQVPAHPSVCLLCCVPALRQRCCFAACLLCACAPARRASAPV